MRLNCRSLAGVAAIGVAVLFATSASAGVEGREENQRDRIEAGIHDGSLTRGEARRLIHQQANIERTERRFRSNDGHLGPRERVVLHRKQDRASKNIFRKRHNRRKR
jgi:hypothetical protein